jgi:hypothetical protein
MKSFVSIRSAVIAAAVLGSFAAVSSAHARSDIQFSISLPGAYVQPAPVYVQPQPYYVQPQPYYQQSQPVYVQPQPVYVQRHGRGHHGRYDPRADWDRDGVPNRFDRAPTNPYYR